MPDELAEQIPMVHAACEALGVPILTSERYEADDVIGTLAVKAAAAGFDVAIVTGDKDFFQLVRDGIRVFNPRDEGTWYDAAGVKEKFGVAPDQVVDVLALMGDTIDNIKGVPGIGEKGARELIATYGSLDNLLAHAVGDQAEALSRSRCSPTRRRRGRAASWRAFGPTCRSTSIPTPFGTAARRASAASRSSTSSAFRTLVAEYAPTAATTSKDYRIVSTADDVRGAGRPARGEPAGSRCACWPTGRSAMTRLDRRPGVFDEPREADYVPTGHRATRRRRRPCRSRRRSPR